MIFRNKKDQTRVKRIYKASKIVMNETGKSYMKINWMIFSKKKNQIHVTRIHKFHEKCVKDCDKQKQETGIWR